MLESNAAVVTQAEAAGLAPPSPLRGFWEAFKENRGAVMGLAVVVLVVLLAVFADLIAPYPPNEQFRDAVRAAPAWADGGSMRFVLGTCLLYTSPSPRDRG